MDALRSLPSVLASAALLACATPEAGDDELGTSESETGAGSESSTDGGDTDTDTGDTDTGGEEGVETHLVTHSFGTYALDPFEEVSPCVQWTIDNDEAIYAQGVTISNYGYFHHSNWFVVPEDEYVGPDGYFDCNERGFTELGAAALGTVLTAQSTQSFAETQRTGDGAVIKIPPRHKVIASAHMLNVGPAPVETELFIGLDLIHPKDVTAVLAPFRLSYYDLDIPANGESRFTGVCDDFAAAYENSTGLAIDHQLHYVLPHYHYLGNYFELSFVGGDLDGESVYTLEGFNGEANGMVFDPPLDLRTIDGLEFTCGYDNWRDVSVGWGIGDQEMCVMLGLADSAGLTDISVDGGTVAVGEQDGVLMFEGSCSYFSVTKNPAQSLPTDEEREGPLYLPPIDDNPVPAVPECVDHDANVAPAIEPTLTNVAGVLFEQSCAFSSCHGSATAAAGLDLMAPDLHAELLDHEVLGNPGASLIEPGDPQNSWLYRLVSECEPQNGDGEVVKHMPLNAPVLLRDPSVALVREWIAAGALDD